MCKEEQSGEERRGIEVDAVDVDLCFAAKDNTARKQRRRDQNTEWTLPFFLSLVLVFEFFNPKAINQNTDS
jgi:hypothetical protein